MRCDTSHSPHVANDFVWPCSCASRATELAENARARQMLDWISDQILAAVTWIPAWLVEEGSPSFLAIRAMFGLLLVVFVFYIIVMLPSRAAIVRQLGRMIMVF